MEKQHKTETAIVEKIKGERYWVKIEKTSACGSCKACNFGKNNHILLPAKTQIECKVGDKVVVKNYVITKFLPSLVLYLLPIICTVLGLILGLCLSEKDLVALACGIVGVLVGFAFIYAIDKIMKKYTLAEIVSKIEQ